MVKKKVDLEGTSLSDVEKKFIIEFLKFDYIDTGTGEVPKIKMGYFIESYLKEPDRKLWEHNFPILNHIRQSMKIAGLSELTKKVTKALILIERKESIHPLQNRPQDWRYCSYYNHYIHVGSRQFTRDDKEGPIHTVDHIHQFAKPEFEFWQGYASSRLVRRDEFPIDPLTIEIGETYYREVYDGRGLPPIGSSTPLENQSNYKSWLWIMRTAFKEEEEKRQKILKLIDEGDYVGVNREINRPT